MAQFSLFVINEDDVLLEAIRGYDSIALTGRRRPYSIGHDASVCHGCGVVQCPGCRWSGTGLFSGHNLAAGYAGFYLVRGHLIGGGGRSEAGGTIATLRKPWIAIYRSAGCDRRFSR